MSTEDLNFRKKSTPAEMKTKEEAPASQKLSTDTVPKRASNYETLSLNSEKIRKVASLFSMALNEYRELRVITLSNREQGVRAEEICDILRLKVLGVLGAEDET